MIEPTPQHPVDLCQIVVVGQRLEPEPLWNGRHRDQVLVPLGQALKDLPQDRVCVVEQISGIEADGVAVTYVSDTVTRASARRRV